MTPLEALLDDLRNKSPLAGKVLDWAGDLLVRRGTPYAADRDINDNVWKIIRLAPLEATLFDTPLLQRLRSVRQLGMAHLVYPGARHSRLEHTLGVVHVSKRMFDILAVGLDDNNRRRWRSMIAIAAMLHDTGHFAFSHLGERVAKDLLGDQFRDIQLIIYQHLPEVLARQSRHDPTIEADSAPSDLVAALFALSPALGSLLSEQNGIDNVREAQMIIASLILGRGYGIVVNDMAYFVLKSIVSGDLDADKIDYVARDGYNAGIPLAVDVERLMSQFQPIDIDIDTGQVDRGRVMGLKPTGASAMEMLVLTRAYLFERLYFHHKVRAAERLVERMLRRQLTGWLALQSPGFSDARAALEDALKRADNQLQILKFLMPLGGDDVLLADIARSGLGAGQRDQDSRRMAENVLWRCLPGRALPLSLRFVAGQINRPDPTAETKWSRLRAGLKPAARGELEQRICELSGLRSADFDIDGLQRNPFDEDPDIWVKTGSNAKPSRVNKHFSVEQLSNAYQELRDTAWVFCYAQHRSLVAAATCIAIYEIYDVVLVNDALYFAKVDLRDFESKLNDIGERFGIPAAVVSAIAKGAELPSLRCPPSNIVTYLPARWREDFRSEAARLLSAKLERLTLPRVITRDLFATLEIVSVLLLHASDCQDRSSKPSDQRAQPEKIFATSLRHYIEGGPLAHAFSSFNEVTVGDGRVDFLFVQAARDPVAVHVELKSEDRPYREIVADHSGQSLAYSEKTPLCRVGILYAQFGGNDPTTIENTLDIRAHPGQDHYTCVIAIGCRGFSRIPSARGKDNKAVL